ncbi:ferrous iron transport protein A [bacterium]|nr:ferrous iron transport protein A [bacterium]
MVELLMPLSVVKPGEEVTLVDIRGGFGMRRKLTDMGLIPGVRLRVIRSHRPGPVILQVGDSRLMLGHGMAKGVMVRR